ncbi:MAG: hypothetical protein Alpg2KO_08530 [Alphaproteobacteria bacterium]
MPLERETIQYQYFRSMGNWLKGKTVMQRRFKSAYFDNQTITIADDVDLDDPQITTVISTSQSLTNAQRLAESRHVHAYYRDFHHMVGGEDWLDELMGIPDTVEDIWQHVTLGDIWVEQDRNRTDTHYLAMEADCAWEEEHGLLLVWKNGQRLTRVSGFDGHMTNDDASATAHPAPIVYAASDPKFTTHLEQG